MNEDTHDVVHVEVNGELDLHSFAPRDVPSLVEEFVRACHEKGIRELRLVHGRGKGVRRAEVWRVLQRHPLVLTFEGAPPTSGGWGATLVRLREHSG